MIRPIQDRIVIRPPQERRSDGGIVIAEAAKSTTRRGVVVAVGPEVSDVRVGDVVFYDGRPMHLDLVSDDVGYRVVRRVEVLGVEEVPAPVDGRCPRCEFLAGDCIRCETPFSEHTESGGLKTACYGMHEEYASHTRSDCDARRLDRLKAKDAERKAARVTELRAVLFDPKASAKEIAAAKRELAQLGAAEGLPN